MLAGKSRQRTELLVGVKRDKLPGSLSEGDKSKIFTVLQLHFLCQLGDDTPEGAEPHPLLLIPDVPHAADLLPGHQVEGRLGLHLCRGLVYEHVLVEEAVWAELVPF